MICFQNIGEIDIEAIRIMGASIKEDGAIGFFGTGLKYAIAVLLREKQRIVIHSGETRLEFGTKKTVIRGRDFDVVTINGEPIGFTTELGKTWKMWMAFRELYCNCTDEGGHVSHSDAIRPESGTTTIEVEGEDFEREYHQRAENFLIDRTPIFSCAEYEVYSGESSYFFYKGVRVHDLDNRSMLTYNVLSKIDLTEDRTAKSYWDVYMIARKAVCNINDERLARRLITAHATYYEAHLDLDYPVFSDEFAKAVVYEYKKNCANLNKTLLKFINRLKPSGLYNKADMSKVQKKQLDKAVNFIQKIGYEATPYKITVVETLGHVVMAKALVEDDEIILSKQCFDKGTKYLASTLIEEVIHIRERLTDESRGLQTYLFDKIISLGEELIGEPI